jgi:hypothetical protein
MGWQDAPLDNSKPSAWASAPLEGAASAPQPSLWERVETSAPARFLRGALDPLVGLVQGAVNVGGYNPILDSYGDSPTGEPYSAAPQAAASRMVNSAIAGQEKQYQAARKVVGQSGMDLPRLAGSLTTNLAGGFGALPAEGAGLLSRMATGAAVGGLFGGAQPIADNSKPYAPQAAANIGFGAAGSAIMPAAVAGVGSLLPKGISAGAHALINNKIPLTVGQTVGGFMKSAEDKLTSVPVVGDAIKAAQARATLGLNRAAINRALAPIGESLPPDLPVGRQAVAYVGQRLGNRYNTLLPTMAAKTDQRFASDIQKIITAARSQLPPSQFRQFRNIVTSQLPFKAGGGNTLDGPTLQGIDSELGRQSAGYASDASFDNRKLGDALGEVKTALSDLVARNNPDKAAELKSINSGWANYVRVRRAASGVGARDGVFSAPQLSNAVRASDKSVAKGDFAKGLALMQDLSDPAAAILPSSVPDSGTAGRILLLEMARHPQWAAPGLFGAALYSRPGQAILRGAAANGVALRSGLNRAGILSAPFAGSLAPILDNQN